MIAPRFSVIMPVDRPGADADRAIQAVLAQTAPGFELLLVSGVPFRTPDDQRIRTILALDRNPALRRNRAAAAARGEILAFIDDDAFASPEWLARAAAHFDREPDLLALGGPDPGPPDAPLDQRISDALLATPLIGSGIACHESRPEAFDLRAPHHVALVNLFVRRDAFEAAGAFDEVIGYIGEDSALLQVLIERGRVAYKPDVVVYHCRRSFPKAYLQQRWRYRVKTGEMLVVGSAVYRNPKVAAFLAAGSWFAIVSVVATPLAVAMLFAYAFGVYVLSWKKARLPLRRKLLLPAYFLMHHGCYFAAILAGMIRGVRKRQAGGA